MKKKKPCLSLLLSMARGARALIGVSHNSSGVDSHRRTPRGDGLDYVRALRQIDSVERGVGLTALGQRC